MKVTNTEPPHYAFFLSFFLPTPSSPKLEYLLQHPTLEIQEVTHRIRTSVRNTVPHQPISQNTQNIRRSHGFTNTRGSVELHAIKPADVKRP